ncbi:TPM domain-containing protein [Strongyloides ratti]|uniref:TPM domain-containing protein n=1 Tax=Strongyloides ratti TaxID=34506 RepID=A0A090LJG4_STRRB|nr:TPM domain-containing protein [Strongyloides ratti]CEF69843.1 TPM domain-containing protein [Strongyloides ratti]
MGMKFEYCLFLGFFSIICIFGQVQWSSDNYPNPSSNQFRQCNMRSKASICDPDQILSEKDRYHINHEIQQLDVKTSQNQAREHCLRKGVSTIVALGKHFGDGSQESIKNIANTMLQKWNLDSQCKKSMIILVATDDRKFWVARDPSVPVYADEFSQMFKEEAGNFKSGDYHSAIVNILKKTADVANSKKELIGGGDNQPSEPSRGGNVGPTDKGGKQGPDFGAILTTAKTIFSKLGIFAWILLFALVSMICCCGCLYLCCCRSKSSPQNDPENPDQPRQGGGNPISGMLQSLGIARIIQMAIPFIRNLISGGGSNQPQGGQGNYSPGVKTNSGPTPMYPTKQVKDEGGGGGW